MKFAPTLILLLFTSFLSTAQNTAPYRNPALPVPERVKDLLSRMTPEEKFWQLFMIPGDLDNVQPGQYTQGIFGLQVSAASKGDAGGQLLSYNTRENGLVLLRKINAIQKFFVEKTRLGIPIIAFDEALHGLVREGATSFPQAIALAATWDTTLMNRVAGAIAEETRARGIRDILTPVVNIASDVRWGRTEETYGEDPLLSSAMGVAFVKAFEDRGIVTTPKHFVANVGDGGRDSYPIFWNDRQLEQVFFPPFISCVKQGGSRSIMTAYNAVDGTASSSNNWLLMQKLKKEWEFKGFVISDANAVGGEVVLHHTAKDYAEAGKNAITNGLDVIFQTEYNHYKLFIPPFLDGSIPQARIDDAVSRVLTAKFELGLFEQPYMDEAAIIRQQQELPHKKIAAEAAASALVLLKNNGALLPVTSPARNIALIGEEAITARLGGYSGTGNGKISILEGIRKYTANVKYIRGAGVFDKETETVPASFLSNDGKPGLKTSIWSNTSLTGKPVMEKTDGQVDFSWTLSRPTGDLTTDRYSIRWEGQITMPQSGEFAIGLEGNDGFRLYINNALHIDQWSKTSYSSRLKKYLFEKGKAYNIRVEFYEPVGNAHIRLIWAPRALQAWKAAIDSAVALARRSDIAIIAAGIHEGEFQDRAYLSLPGHQEDLILAVAATGKPVVVLLTGGSAITMQRWLDKVQAVIHCWYPGEAGGEAIAAVLFGDRDPGGRLPITFPVHESQLPLVYNHHPTGRGDDYHNLSGLPLFPFGYGLSYTQFSYGPLTMNKSEIAPDDSIDLHFTLTNTGKRTGEEVVQLYVNDLLSSVTRPVLELHGFQKVKLDPGEKKELHFVIGPKTLQLLNREMKRVVEPGQFRLMIGASSRDIRQEAIITVK
ncbi:glycoside hydrolase family 3 protein [Flavihumibacter petaseus]|uniref:Putative beta-glucosidase n=1 Tax=Flavihumibacter petaseus NBRC 106054 TaxID=1220578 RepID=A0A0E9MZR1_9BACT|nr:glycoside hydrolase family 3 protein [Flavihumibacter petaseus]GAO43247.1 putative beta-glucosidase [Flavihumibacter petaseus NBRC 106054]